ncbi:MAG: hypothetical protein HQ525_02525 [Anaerolineae bacterium]|nr:hypothetical protein [Anaerolineae bacterium]
MLKKNKLAALRWYFSLTIIEILVAGILLWVLPQLDKSSPFEFFSASRIILSLLWSLFFTLTIWVTITTLSEKERDRNYLLDFFRIEDRYLHTKDWLIVLGFFSWGTVAFYLYFPEFWSFVWSGALFLLERYWSLLLMVGIWTCQSLYLFLILKTTAFSVPKEKEPVFAKGILIFLFVFSVYAYIDARLHVAHQPRAAYFPQLAEAFLTGKLTLPALGSTVDLSLFNGEYYLSFPPLAALMMMPIVALTGAEDVNTAVFNVFFAALGVMATFFMLEALKRRGWSRLRWWENAALAIFLGMSTAQFYFAARGVVYFTSQILTTTFSTISLWIALKSSKKNEIRLAFFAGSALAIAILARPNIGIVVVALAAIQLQIWHERGDFSLRTFFGWTVSLSIPIVFVVVALLWYNEARFGSPFDFGYTYMLVGEYLKADLQNFGQFHPHFIWENIYDNFLRFPYWDKNCQVLAPNPNGMSVFITSPLIIYLYKAFKKEIWVIGTWLSVGVLLLVHLLYFNSGALQYGYRFSLDFMPLVIMLLAFGFRHKLPKLGYILLSFGIAVNYIGVLWITHRWCENF